MAVLEAYWQQASREARHFQLLQRTRDPDASDDAGETPLGGSHSATKVGTYAIGPHPAKKKDLTWGVSAVVVEFPHAETV
jgi:hypothetical protein